eukprot:3348606-Rhodomonas_salina.1
MAGRHAPVSSTPLPSFLLLACPASLAPPCCTHTHFTPTEPHMHCAEARATQRIWTPTHVMRSGKL